MANLALACAFGIFILCLFNLWVGLRRESSLGHSSSSASQLLSSPNTKYAPFGSSENDQQQPQPQQGQQHQEEAPAGQEQQQEQQQQQQQQSEQNQNELAASANQEPQEVTFLNTDSIHGSEYFSAVWWQSTDRFLNLFQPDKIKNVVGAIFAFTSPRQHREVTMTTDWLQFSVEHMSKAWKLTGYDRRDETPAYHLFTDKLLSYVGRSLSSPGIGDDSSSLGAMPQTLAMISFMPYRSKVNPTRGQVLTLANLAATIAPLVRLRCGRILILVDRPEFADEKTNSILWGTRDVLLQSLMHQQQQQYNRTWVEHMFDDAEPITSMERDGSAPRKPFEFKIQHTEIALMIVNCKAEDQTKTKGYRLIPKAGLLNLRQAMSFRMGHDDLNATALSLLAEKENSNDEDRIKLRHATKWLGTDLQAWKYVYISEADTILHAKPSALPALSRELDRGMIAVPHRLQPMPHASDLPSDDDDFNQRNGNKKLKKKNRVLPSEGSFSHVVVASSGDKCCDAGDDRPGFVPFAECKSLWFNCGFGGNKTLKDHFRLEHYDLMRLNPGGTGIVLLSGTNHGRKCIPKKAHESCQ